MLEEHQGCQYSKGKYEWEVGEKKVLKVRSKYQWSPGHMGPF